jgi:phosphatidylserine/phosphatidylglycerophosphate/cardiolipin synthase-like enzyme
MTNSRNICGVITSTFQQRVAKRGDSCGSQAMAESLETELKRALVTGGLAGFCEGVSQAVNELADRTDRVSLAVTGLGWLGAGVPAVERTLTDLLDAASHEILLTVYSMTPGTGRVWDAIEKALATGIRCTLIANRLDEQHPDLRALFLELARRHPVTLRIYTFTGADDRDALHAKLVIVDRQVALVGSANLTFHGLVSAHELAIVVRGPTVEQIASRFDLLLRSQLVQPYSG